LSKRLSFLHSMCFGSFVENQMAGAVCSSSGRLPA
jgi:hypothetical protein